MYSVLVGLGLGVAESGVPYLFLLEFDADNRLARFDYLTPSTSQAVQGKTVLECAAEWAAAPPPD